MKDFLRCLLAAAVLSSGSPSLWAHCRVVRVQKAQAVKVVEEVKEVKKVVVEEKVAAVAAFVPVVALLPPPIYSVGYQEERQAAYPYPYPERQAPRPALAPGFGPRQAVPNCEERLAALERRLNAALSGKAEANGTVEPGVAGDDRMAAVAPDNSVPPVFLSKCARCHEARVSAAEGKGFTLLKGSDLVEMSAEEALNVWDQCRQGHMPKGGALTDAEFSSITEWVAKYKTKK